MTFSASHSSAEAEKEVQIDIITPSSRSWQSGRNDPKSEAEHGEEIEDEDIEACGGSITRPQDNSGDPKSEVLMRRNTKSSWKDPGPPPDGGRVAWTQALMAHIVIFNTWGYINSFGVFQDYYTTTLNLSPSSISWIGSIQVFLLFSLGTFSGRLTDAGYFRPLFLIGTVLQLLGTFLTSISHTYWALFLTEGVLTGIGDGLMFCPAITILSTYFKERRGVALGICACGSATGGVVFPVMVQQLLPVIGYGWTVRTVGFLQMALLVLANCFFKPRLPPRKSGRIVEWAAFKDAEYSLFAAGMFFNFWGVYFAFYYIASYATTILNLSYTDSINLLIILNGVGVIGRLFPNFLGDKVTGPINLIIPASIICVLLLYSWIAVSSTTGLYVWAVVYGIFGAAIQGLFPVCLSSLTTDLQKAGTRMGMVFSIVAFAVLTGPPLAGALISNEGGSYLGAQLFAGTSLLLGCGLLIACRYVKSGGVLMYKV